MLRPSRSGLQTTACRASRIRISPPRHAVAVRRARYQDGAGHRKTAARHTSADFVDFLGEVVAQCWPKQEIHIILDNLPAHKTQAVRDFLARLHVRLQFTPTYSLWRNQFELWFAKIERDVSARGVFTSAPDLARKLRRHINA